VVFVDVISAREQPQVGSVRQNVRFRLRIGFSDSVAVAVAVCILKQKNENAAALQMILK